MSEIDPAAVRHYVAAYFQRDPAQVPRPYYSVQTPENTVVVRVITPMALPFRVPGVGTDVPITGTAASVIVASARSRATGWLT